MTARPDLDGWQPDPDRPGYLIDPTRPTYLRNTDGQWFSKEAVDAVLNGPPSLTAVPDPDPPSGASWTPVDLAAVLASGSVEVPPTVLWLDNGQALFYPGKINDLHGEPESGKGWLYLMAAKQELRVGNRVVVIDYEDTPGTLINRLLALGIPSEAIEAVIYVQPNERLPGPLLEVVPEIAAAKPTLAVIDGVTEAMMLEGLAIESNVDIARFRQRLSGPLATTGAAAVEVDHVTKDRESRGRWAIGGQAKLSGITGASYQVVNVNPFRRGGEGMSRIEVAKDRLGFVRSTAAGGKRVGEFHLTSDPDGTITGAEIRTVGDGPLRPTVLMERVSRFLENLGDEASTNTVLSAVPGNQEGKREALKCLFIEEYVGVRPRGQSRLYRSLRPFREGGPTGTMDTGLGRPGAPNRDPTGTMRSRIVSAGQRGTGTTGTQPGPAAEGTGTPGPGPRKAGPGPNPDPGQAETGHS